MKNEKKIYPDFTKDLVSSEKTFSSEESFEYFSSMIAIWQALNLTEKQTKKSLKAFEEIRTEMKSLFLEEGKSSSFNEKLFHILHNKQTIRTTYKRAGIRGYSLTYGLFSRSLSRDAEGITWQIAEEYDRFLQFNLLNFHFLGIRNEIFDERFEDLQCVLNSAYLSHYSGNSTLEKLREAQVDFLVFCFSSLMPDDVIRSLLSFNPDFME